MMTNEVAQWDYEMIKFLLLMVGSIAFALWRAYNEDKS